MTQNPNTRLPRTPKVRRWVGLLTQSGTDIPTAQVLFNTVGTITWVRNSAGNYTGTLPDIDPDGTNTTTAWLGINVNSPAQMAVLPYTNEVEINTTLDNTPTYSDNLLNDTLLKIEVYEQD